MDELFIKYMFYLRAKDADVSLTTKGTRNFFEKDDYSALRQETVFPTLWKIAEFWNEVSGQNTDIYAKEILKRFSIISQAPNILPSHFLTTYHLLNSEASHEELLDILDRLIACVLLYAICKPGLDYLRTPLYNEMAHYAATHTINFKEYALWTEAEIRLLFEKFRVSRNPVTKFLLF